MVVFCCFFFLFAWYETCGGDPDHSKQSVRELTNGTNIMQVFGKEAGAIEQGTS